MRDSRRFIKFALCFCVLALASSGLGSCKGRTMENMEPSGDTVEVVIMQDTVTESPIQTISTE